MQDNGFNMVCAASKVQKPSPCLYRDSEKVTAYQEELAGIAPEQIAYVDETGIDTYLYREYGYAPKGQKIHAAISGRKYIRVGIVAAQLGGKNHLAACIFWHNGQQPV